MTSFAVFVRVTPMACFLDSGKDRHTNTDTHHTDTLHMHTHTHTNTLTRALARTHTHTLPHTNTLPHTHTHCHTNTLPHTHTEAGSLAYTSCPGSVPAKATEVSLYTRHPKIPRM